MSDTADGDEEVLRSSPGEPAPDGEGSVTLVGTAHVSEESIERVEGTIEDERPDVVAVELDEGRYKQMQGETPDDLEPADLLGGNTVFQFLAYWMLSWVQSRLGDRFDVEPGADMKAAVETAEGLGLGVALVDRDIQVTIQRFWRRMTGTEKLTLVAQLALGVASPLYLGVTVGATFGAVFGLAFGALGAPAVGLGAADFTALLGAGTIELLGVAVGGVIAGLVAWTVLDPSLRSVAGLGQRVEYRGAASVALGLVGAVAVFAAGGVALGPFAVGPGTFTTLGGGLLQLLSGVLVGVAVGVAVGGIVGGLLEPFVSVDDELDEEFDPEELTDTDVITAMLEEFRRFSPGGAEALIDERDAFIAHRLHALREAGYRVVAVVGAGHREGIQGYLDDPESLPPLEELTGTISGRRFSLYKVFGYLFTVGFAVFFGLLALGVSTAAERAFLIRVLVAWFLFNGVFAYGLARIAGARWPSAAVGGAVAWLTSLNPLLAPGWFAGYVELRYTTVNVSDIGTLNELLSDEERPLREIVADMYDVPLFRLIMIVAMTNVGSMIASFMFAPVVLPWIAPEIGGVSGVVELMWDGLGNGLDFLRGVVGV